MCNSPILKTQLFPCPVFPRIFTAFSQRSGSRVITVLLCIPTTETLIFYAKHKAVYNVCGLVDGERISGPITPQFVLDTFSVALKELKAAHVSNLF